MAEFEELELDAVTQEFEVYPPAVEGDRSVGFQETLIALQAARTARPIEDIRLAVEKGFAGNLGEASRTRTQLGIEGEFVQGVVEAARQTSIQRLVDVENARAQAHNDSVASKAPEVDDIVQNQGGSLYDQKFKRTVSRRMGTMKLIDEKMQNASVSTFGIIGDVLDIIVSAPLDGLTGAGFRRNKAVEDLRNLMSAEISDEKYYEEAEGLISDLYDAGWFTNENYLMLAGGAANIYEGGVGSTATLERIGGALDLGFGLASGAKLGLRASRLFKNSTAVTAVLSGPEQAGMVLADAVARPGSLVAEAAGVARETLPSMLRSVESGGTHFSYLSPGSHVAAKAETENRFWTLIQNLQFNKRIDPAVFEAWRPTGLRKLQETVETTTRKRVNNLILPDPDVNGNIVGVVVLGRADGLPYKDLRSATAAAKKEGGRVATEVLGGESRYTVHIEKNLSSEGLATTLDAGEIGQHFFRSFGGTFLSIPKRLDALAKRGESVLSNVATAIGPILEANVKAMAKGEEKTVEAIFYSLRDGDKFAEARRPFTMSEFRAEWSIHSSTPPSLAAEKHYLDIQELNDALFYMKADPIYKQVVDEGGEVLEFSIPRRNGDPDVYKHVVNKTDRTAIEADEVIYNVSSGEHVLVGKVKESQTIYKVRGGHDTGNGIARYVVSDDPIVRRLHHDDVLGYNPGGSRNYPNLNYYLKQAVDVVFLNGREAAGRARTFMGTFSRAEALSAAADINIILAAVRKEIQGIAGLTRGAAIDALEGLKGNAALTDLIRSHNGWNPSIEGADDLAKFFRDQRMNPLVDVEFGAAEDALAKVSTTGETTFGVHKGETNRDAFESALNQPRNGPRRNDPLLGYGGQVADTVSPMDMIQRDLMRAAHSKAFEAYNYQSITGWLAGARQYHTKDLTGMTANQAFRAISPEDFGKAPGPEARSYMVAQDAISRTLGHKSSYETKWEAMINRTSEWVYNKGGAGKRVGEILRDSKVAKNPLEFLRALTFDARLGMLDPGQLLVQASQTFNILAVIGPRRGGEWLQSAVTHIPLRLAMRTEDAATILEIGRRSAAFTGMPAEEFVQFAKFVRDSGRLNVGQEVAERSGTSTVLAQGMSRRVLGASRVFFNEGEKMPRSAALSTAWKEYKREFPKLDPFKEHGLKWIDSRQDALTAGMTGRSAAAWQKGPASIPLQFMTYSSRMLESIFTDRLLTNTERVRLASAQVAFWGAAGTGLGSFLDAYILEDGLQMDETTYTLLRYGAIDAFTNATLGTQGVFGGRLAMAEGFTSLVGNWRDDNFAEVIGGPAGGLAKDITFTLWDVFGDIASGSTSMLEADLLKFTRNFTGPNKLYNAWMMYNTETYLSRNGSVVVDGITKPDAMLALLGAQMRDANLAYSRLETMANQDAAMKEHVKRIKEKTRVMHGYVNEGDWAGAEAVGRDISASIAVLPPWQQQIVYKAMYPELDSFASSLWQKGTVERFMGGLKSNQGEE